MGQFWQRFALIDFHSISCKWLHFHRVPLNSTNMVPIIFNVRLRTSLASHWQKHFETEGPDTGSIQIPNFPAKLAQGEHVLRFLQVIHCMMHSTQNIKRMFSGQNQKKVNQSNHSLSFLTPVQNQGQDVFQEDCLFWLFLAIGLKIPSSLCQSFGHGALWPFQRGHPCFWLKVSRAAENSRVPATDKCSDRRGSRLLWKQLDRTAPSKASWRIKVRHRELYFWSIYRQR